MRILKRHQNREVNFTAFDNRTYYGRIDIVRNGIAKVVYDRTNDNGLVVQVGCTSYLDRTEQTRLTLI